MRQAMLAILAVITCLSVGCHHNLAHNSCRHCGLHGHGHGHGSGAPSRVARLPHGYMEEQMDGPAGPPTSTYAYPYYTTRAPRDFLLDNPPSIGP